MKISFRFKKRPFDYFLHSELKICTTVRLLLIKTHDFSYRFIRLYYNKAFKIFWWLLAFWTQTWLLFIHHGNRTRYFSYSIHFLDDLQTSILNLLKYGESKTLQRFPEHKKTLERERETLNLNPPPQRLLYFFNIDLAIIPSCLLKSLKILYLNLR